MENAMSWPTIWHSRWREFVLPKEHGSWSLALEPVAFALLVAPSTAGVWLGLAAVAGFFSRRPLRIARNDSQPARRATARESLVVCASVAVIFGLSAIAFGGWKWLLWLMPSAFCGGVFLYFDVRQAGREELAEVAGAAAFAWLPAAFGAAAGWSSPACIALAVVMLGRAVPTVLCVRALLRGTKTGVWRIAPALAAAGLAMLAVALLARAEIAPWSAAGFMIGFCVRAMVLLWFPRPILRARTIGIAEAIFGVVFVVAVAAAWRT